SFQNSAARSAWLTPMLWFWVLAATRKIVIPASPFTGRLKVKKSFTPSKHTAGRPLTVAGTSVGWLAAVFWLAFRLFPDSSVHCVTPRLFVTTSPSAFSHKTRPWDGTGENVSLATMLVTAPTGLLTTTSNRAPLSVVSEVGLKT